MKRICTLVLLLIVCAGARAQEDRFSVRDGGVVWQTVYQSQMDSAQVIGALIGSGLVEDAAGIPGGVACRVRLHAVNWKAAGFERMAVPLYLVNNQMTAHAVVLFREGRYRVTVDQIVFVSPSSTSLRERGETTPLESYAVNGRGELKRVFYSMNAAPVLDYDLLKIFEVSAPVEEDW